MKAETLRRITEELAKARAKHPGNKHKLAALMEEVGEVAKALLERKPRAVKAEAIQVAVVAIRLIEEGDSDFEEAVEV